MGQREGEGVGGKYILIEAPNFNNASSEAEAMSSYLRLGAVKDPALAASAGAPKATGEDLAALVTTFVDDNRVREGCPDYLPPGVRQAETALLHSKGGWRDHSDGNRITTTRGDKVEVIKGNYRMLILGRQNDEAGWDISGGHVNQGSITCAGSSSIEWTQNYDGSWKVTEETLKGDVFTTYMGDVHDVFQGNIRSSVTGSEAPSKEKPNPAITDRTWALSIASYTGSAALPIPTMSDETWVGEMTSTTTATSITSKTEAISITDTTGASTISSTTTADTITDVTTCAVIASTTIGNIFDTTIGTTTSVIVGTEAEIVVGNMSEITLGLEESITVGGVLDVSVAGRIEVNVSTGLQLTVGGLSELNPAHKDELSTIKNQLSTMKNELALTKQAVGAVYEDFHGQIMLG
ncbi:MAG: hypothetical protein HOW73_51215 [Polyangiaceae bacterium]|nr:hypothetical protein [Polyangiaceae bacterium]